MTETDNIFKKLFLAGIGAVALGAEKAEALTEELIKRGELTVEQGKVVNEELKHRITKVKDAPKKSSIDLEALSPEERKELLQRLRDIDKDNE